MSRFGTQTPLLPILGSLLCVGLILSRQPDAVRHAQFWAEDGRFYYADVYNHGLLATLVKPQAGYFQTFSVLAAGLARLVPLAQAPLVMNGLGIAAQTLPVSILLSRRAVSIAPDLRVRALLAFSYIAVNAPELNANAVNAQWHLAVAALLVLMLAPPQGPWGRTFDTAVLLLTGLTGPFCLLLAPLAFVQRRLRGPAGITAWQVGMLAACAVLQAASLLVISHHYTGDPTIEPRLDPALGASPSLFLKIVGGRLLAGTVIGDRGGLDAPFAAQLLIGLTALVGLVLVARSKRWELQLAVAFAAAVFALALVRPNTPPPAWSFLATPGAATRYFFIPQVAVLAVLVWIAAEPWWLLIRIGAAALVAASIIVAVSSGWSYPRLEPAGFPHAAAAFERAPRGSVRVFPLNPPPVGIWTMTLRKH